jgi:hypothetical protein
MRDSHFGEQRRIELGEAGGIPSEARRGFGGHRRFKGADVNRRSPQYNPAQRRAS